VHHPIIVELCGAIDPYARMIAEHMSRTSGSDHHRE
jgi:hypothetical protein